MRLIPAHLFDWRTENVSSNGRLCPHLNVAQLDRRIVFGVSCRLLEQVFNRAHHHSPRALILEPDVGERVRLSRSRLAVCQHCAVVTLQYALEKRKVLAPVE